MYVYIVCKIYHEKRGKSVSISTDVIERVLAAYFNNISGISMRSVTGPNNTYPGLNTFIVTVRYSSEKENARKNQIVADMNGLHSLLEDSYNRNRPVQKCKVENITQRLARRQLETLNSA